MGKLNAQQVKEGLINLQYFKYSDEVVKEMAETIYETAMLVRSNEGLHLFKQLNEAKDIKNNATKGNNTPNEVLGELFNKAFLKLQEKREHLASLINGLCQKDYDEAVFTARILSDESPLSGSRYDYKVRPDHKKEMFKTLNQNFKFINETAKELGVLNRFSKKAFDNYAEFLQDKNDNYENLVKKEKEISEKLHNSLFLQGEIDYMRPHAERALRKYTEEKQK